MKVTKAQLRRIIRESLNEMHPGDWDKPGVEKDPQRPWGTYAEKDDGKYWDTIMMSPNGDSLFSRRPRNIPSRCTLHRLQGASGIEMSDVDADNLIFALEDSGMQRWLCRTWY